MVEGAALEKRYTLTGIVGSNPTLSANVWIKKNHITSPSMKTFVKNVVAGGVLTLLLAACTQTAPVSPQPNGEKKNADAISSQENKNIHTEMVPYYGSTEGFLAQPIGNGEYPGIVMIHEWWGLNENIKAMAEKLAQEGYIVLAVDLYNGKVGATAEEARKLTGSIDQEESVRNLRAAVSYLRNHDASKIASLGWCFGGGKSLQLALSGEKLAATVIYYGQLETDKEKLSAINWPVLGIFGADDTSIPVDSVEKFQTALNEENIENSITIYPGVGHAFANPSGANYAPDETLDAWVKTLTFLKENLKDEEN